MSEKQPPENNQSPDDHERDVLRDFPRIWVGSLADYNNGRLHGEWIDAAVSDGSLAAAVQRMLASSSEPSAEEYGIFDYENFGNFRVHEYDRLEKVARIARGIVQYGPAFAAWAELHDGDATMLDRFDEAFLGEYDSPSDWAHAVLIDGGLLGRDLDRFVPEYLRPYVQIDCVGWVRDAHLGGDIHIEWIEPGGRVWIFNSL